MAKWIYERWSLKWDSSLTSTSAVKRSAIARVDIRTMEAIETSVFAEGDIAINSQTNLSRYNSGLSVSYLLFHEATTTGSGLTSQTSSMTKDQLVSMRIKGTLIDTVKVEEGTYPDDGIHTDGYWYIKVKKAFPVMRILRNGQWVEVETGYVLKDGVWKQIEEIYKLQDGQWVRA